MDNQKSDKPNGSQAQESGSRNAAAAQRYCFSITDTERKDGPLTISIEVENDAIIGMTATDDKDGRYDINFHLKLQKPGGEFMNVAPHPGPPHGHGDDNGDDDDDDDDGDGDECQVCQVVGGKLLCYYVAC
jgi:hypothetical protein